MSRDPIILSFLSMYETFGIPVVNPTRSVWITNSKPSIFAIMAKRGIPTLPTQFVYGISKAVNLNKLLKGRKVLKGQRSDFKIFSKTVSFNKKWGFHQLDSNALNIIQDFVKPDSEIKVYVIGRQTFLKDIKNPCCSPSSKKILSGKLLSEIKKSAIQIGRLSGLEIYNVDILIKDSQFYIVDVNDFPSFKKIPKAAGKISDYLIQKVAYHNRDESKSGVSRS